jgi:transcriptional regulator with XRE-family HTH domain
MIEKELKKLGKRIRKLRLANKITLAQLAAECDFEKSNMARIEQGNTNPTYKTLYKISKALSITISDLVDLE